MPTTQTFPKQRVAYSKKMANDMKWAKDTMDSIELDYYSFNSTYGEQIQKYSSLESHKYSTKNRYDKMRSNYRLYNNIITQADFDKTFNPLGIDVNQFKDEIQPYNKSYNKIQVLLGEELKRPFNFRPYLTDSEGIRSKLVFKDELLYDYVNAVLDSIRQRAAAQVQSELDPEQMTPEQQQQIEQQIQASVDKVLPPSEIEKYMNDKYLSQQEVVSSKILKYLKEQQRIKDKRQDAFKHALISSQEIHWVGIRNNEPTIDIINPLGFNYHKSPEEKYIQKSLYAEFRTRMHSGDILDNFGDYLPEKHIKRIEGPASGNFGITDRPFNKDMKYGHYDIQYEYEKRGINETFHTGSYGLTETSLDDSIVSHMEWRSQKRIGFLEFVNEFGDIEKEIVSEDFVVPDYAQRRVETGKYGMKTTYYDFDGMTLNWSWIPEIWQGVKIGYDIYCCIGPKEHQFRSKENPKDVKLGYHGLTYNAMNAEPVSLLERMKPFQYLYFIVVHKLKQLIAKDHGQVFSIDVTMIPEELGLEKTLYYLNEMDLDFYNPLQNAEQPGAYNRGKVTSSISRSNMQHIMNYINLMSALDQQISEVAGVTPQREGASTAHEAVTNAQQSIVRSSIITEPFFNAHDNAWKYSLESLLQIARNHWKGQTVRKQVVLDDLSVHSLELMEDDIADVDIGLFVANGGKETEIFSQLQEITRLLTAKEKAKVSDILKMLRAESTIELQREIEQSERSMEAKESSLQQQQQQIEQQKIESAKELAEDQQAHEKELKLLDIEGKKEVAEIQAFAFQRDQDSNRDGVPDQLQIDEFRQKTAIEHRKLDIEERRLDQEKDLKEKELKQKPRPSSN